MRAASAGSLGRRLLQAENYLRRLIPGLEETSACLNRVETAACLDVLSSAWGLSVPLKVRNYSIAPCLRPISEAGRAAFNPSRGISGSALLPQSQFRAPAHFSDDDDFDDSFGTEAGPDAGELVPHFESIQNAADFVRQNLDTLSTDDVGDIMQQVVELHFQKIAEGKKRAEYIMPALDLIQLVLQKGSPLINDGEAVAHTLWAASKLRMKPVQVDKEALLPAIENSMHKLSPNGLASVMWAIGQLRMPPSQRFWDTVTDRLFGEGQCTYLKMYELVPAISGICSLPESARQTPLPEYMMREVAKHISSGGSISPRDLSSIADFLPITPPSATRTELLKQVLQHARRLAPRLEHVATANILWAAARLQKEGTIDPETVRALLQRAQDTLQYNRGHAVPDLLWSLGKLGYRVDDGVVTEEFLQECLESQRVAMRRDISPAKVLKLLTACNLLGITLSEEDLRVCLDQITRQDFKRIDGLGIGALTHAFQRLNYQPGVDACQARKAHRGGRARSEGPLNH